MPPRNNDPTQLEPRPMAAALGPTSNAAQLKRDIESGATGDKVPMLDPGLSPLGTDDEAAGQPLDPQMVAELRAAERRNAPPPGDTASHPRPWLRKQRAGLVLAGVLCLVLVAAALVIGG